MPEEFNFSELRNYLQGQIDMGFADVTLDEPWALVKPQRAASQQKSTPTPVPSAPRAPSAAPAFTPKPAAPTPSLAVETPVFIAVAMPSARPAAKKSAAAFESAETLDAFYEAIQGEAVYGNVANLARYEGPANPKLLLLMPRPLPDTANFFTSEPGAMLVRLFANLNVAENEIGVTYFYKSAVARNIPALLETALRKMLTKELSFIAPQVMATFGEPLFHQIFGKGKNFNDLAGTDLEFAGIKTCALVDAVEMSKDKQLKWVTWKVHIPKSTYFKA